MARRLSIWLPHNAYWITPIAIMVIMAFCFGFNGLYGQDSHEYLRFASALKDGGLSQEVLGEFHWPIAFPIAGILLSYTGIPLLWALNIVSLGAAIATLIFCQKLIELLYAKNGRLWLLLAAATQVYFIRGGILVMSDMLCTFFITAIFYYLVRYYQKAELKALILLALCAGLAFFTRYASAPLLLAPVGVAIILALKKVPRILQFISVILLIFIVVWVGWMNNRMWSLGSAIINEWSLENVFSFSIETSMGTVTRMVPNIAYVFGGFGHIGFLSLGVLLLPFYKHRLRGTMAFVIASSLVFYFLLLVGLNTQNYRFLILAQPLVLVLLFGAFDHLQAFAKSKRLLGLLIAGTLLFNAAFFVYSFRKTYAVHQTEKEVVAALRKIGGTSPIYSFYVDQSFPSYGVSNEVRNLFMEEYHSFEKGALVVYNPEKFQEQWGTHRVGKNWNTLASEYNLDTLAVLSNNWKIYRIK